MSPVGRESLVTPELPLVCLDSPLLLLDCSARGGGGNGPEKKKMSKGMTNWYFSKCPMGHLIGAFDPNISIIEGPQTNKALCSWIELSKYAK